MPLKVDLSFLLRIVAAVHGLPKSETKMSIPLTDCVEASAKEQENCVNREEHEGVISQADLLLH